MTLVTMLMLDGEVIALLPEMPAGWGDPRVSTHGDLHEDRSLTVAALNAPSIGDQLMR